MKSSALRAIPLMLLATLALSTLDATAKYLSQDYSVLLITWARYAGHIVLVLFFAWRARGPRFVQTRRLGLQLTRSAFILAATLCFFTGLRYVPIAEATAVAFLSPVFVIVLARPMLGEQGTPARWLTVAAGLVGVLLIARPGGVVFQPATLLLLGMAVFNGLYQLLTRKLAGEDVYTTLFYSALVGAVAMTLAWPWIAQGPLPKLVDIPLFVLLGVLGGGGHLLLIHAYSRAPAAMITPFGYMQMVWGTLYGWMLFGHLPDAASFVGMACILAGGIWLARSERREARLGAALALPPD
jgi:drug/metabolite transporter (DMT)-like permease